MDASEAAFRLREMIDIHLCHVSLPDFLYGKVKAEERHKLWDDILKLKLDEASADCYVKCQELMDKQCSHLMTFVEEYSALTMCIAKQRHNVDSAEDHIDGVNNQMEHFHI